MEGCFVQPSIPFYYYLYWWVYLICVGLVYSLCTSFSFWSIKFLITYKKKKKVEQICYVSFCFFAKPKQNFIHRQKNSKYSNHQLWPSPHKVWLVRQQVADIKKHLQPTFQFIRSLLASLLTQIKEQTSKLLAKYFISDRMPFKDTLQMLLLPKYQPKRRVI